MAIHFCCWQHKPDGFNLSILCETWRTVAIVQRNADINGRMHLLHFFFYSKYYFNFYRFCIIRHFTVSFQSDLSFLSPNTHKFNNAQSLSHGKETVSIWITFKSLARRSLAINCEVWCFWPKGERATMTFFLYRRSLDLIFQIFGGQYRIGPAP